MITTSLFQGLDWAKEKRRDDDAIKKLKTDNTAEITRINEANELEKGTLQNNVGNVYNQNNQITN